MRAPSCAGSRTDRWRCSRRPATRAGTRRSIRWRSTASTPRRSGTSTISIASSISITRTRDACAAAAPGQGRGRGGGRPQPDPIDFAASEGWTSLFDGKSLNGWSGDSNWKVEAGAITIESTCEKPTGTIYLVWQGGEAADFELKMEMKGTGSINGGVQYRGWIAPNPPRNPPPAPAPAAATTAGATPAGAPPAGAPGGQGGGG